MGTRLLAFVSVTPPCSSDTFKSVHLSFRSEICFYNFAKTFIYGSGQLAAGRAMCQWSWRMLNVWYGSVQTASTWFANILVLCIYKAASERKGFLSEVLQHGRQFIILRQFLHIQTCYGKSSFFLACIIPLDCSHLSHPTRYSHLLLHCQHFHRNSTPPGLYNETRRGKPLHPPPSPAGHMASRRYSRCVHANPLWYPTPCPWAWLEIRWQSRHPCTDGHWVGPHSCRYHREK